MLYIYSRQPNNYFSKEYLKYLARLVLRKTRGPQAVTSSLLRGLDESKVEYFFNAKHRFTGTETIFINESLDALRWGIKLKEKGLIKKLVSGPNVIAISPLECGEVLRSPEIDIILVPSEWVRSWWLSLTPELSNKIKVWASGCQDFYQEKKSREKIIIYVKTVPEKVLNYSLAAVKQMPSKYQIIEYGKFNRKKYLKLLEESNLMVYLQESETQGISLLEAWSENIPTFVYNQGFYKYHQYYYKGDKIAAPYLNDKTGAFFSNAEELASLLKDFFAQKLYFKPREEYLNNFTDQICAVNFLKLIE